MRYLLIPLFTISALAHERPTHQALSVQAAVYIQSTDQTRKDLLPPNLASILRDGAWNEDNAFTNCSSYFGTSATGPCYLGRYYFHFLEQADQPLNDPSLLQRASCSSIDWGITGSFCQATSVSGLFDGLNLPVGSSPLMMNAHTWGAALSSTDPATGAPTEMGWRHLGYVIHLLEDLTSPPHTRNSGHPCIGGVLLCDPFEPDNVGSTVNVPAADYLEVGTLSSPDELFRTLQAYTHDGYYSARTAFNLDGGPVKLFEDPFYIYGPCLPVSIDVGTCGHFGSLGIQGFRKIAHKGLAWYAASLSNLPTADQYADIDTIVAQEQFAELAPVAVEAVARLIKYYAPVLTLNVQGSGSVQATPGNVTCTKSAPCPLLLTQGTSVTLVATWASPATFVGWSGTAPGCSGTSASISVRVTDDTSCTGTFNDTDITGTWMGVYQYGPECVSYTGIETLVLTDSNGSISGTVTDTILSPTTGTVGGTVSGTFGNNTLNFTSHYTNGEQGTFTGTLSGNTIAGMITGICGNGATVTFAKQ